MMRRRVLGPPVLTAAFVLAALAAGSPPSMAQMGAGRSPSTMGGSPTEARPAPPAAPDNSPRLTADDPLAVGWCREATGGHGASV